MKWMTVAVAAVLALAIGGGASATATGANGRIVFATDGDITAAASSVW